MRQVSEAVIEKDKMVMACVDLAKAYLRHSGKRQFVKGAGGIWSNRKAPQDQKMYV